MKHKLNKNTLVCSCGRTKEEHIEIAMVCEKIRGRWTNGDINLERDFSEIKRSTNQP